MYRFQIAYNKHTKTVEIFPDSNAPSPQTMLIGEFRIDNPKAPFESYRADLSEAVEKAMAYVGQPDLTGWEVKVKTWLHDEFIVAKERHPIDVGLDTPATVVPVTEDVTIAEAAYREQSGDLVETDADAKPKTGKAAKKAQQDD